MENIIVFIGLQDSGKTVFLSTFADEYARAKVRGCWMEPRTTTTAEYIFNQINALRNQEWPSMNLPGKFYHLDFDLHCNGTQAMITSLDISGETYKEFVKKYGDRGSIRNEINQNTEIADLTNLKKSLDDSTCVFIFIDLHKIINGKHDYMDLYFPLAVFNYLGIEYKKISIVLTKTDRLQPIFEQHENSWKLVLRTYMPGVYQKVVDTQTKIFPVAAVSQVVFNKNSGEYVPAKNFKSTGLQDIMAHILSTIEQSRAKAYAKAKAEAKKNNNDFAWLVMVIFLIFVIFGLINYFFF